MYHSGGPILGDPMLFQPAEVIFLPDCPPQMEAHPPVSERTPQVRDPELRRIPGWPHVRGRGSGSTLKGHVKTRIHVGLDVGWGHPCLEDTVRPGHTRA